MHYYVVHIQFLGYRYHGWIKQPNVKTIQGVIEKRIAYVLGHQDFKTLGTSRTDARVSANHMAFELFMFTPLDKEKFIYKMNITLPPDIRILYLTETDKYFNIIKSSKIKEYVYLFSYGNKAHPFAAPLMANFPEMLNIEKMKEGALLYEGRHNFFRYVKRPSVDPEDPVREIKFSRIIENDILTANFFPERSFAYHIHASGFLRFQIRLMMGQLTLLGKGEITLNDIKESLTGKDDRLINNPAPAAGLMLNKIIFDDKS